ncbi:MAG: hypothetical protein WC325_08440 [Candidatus Bathyarchaeia archaeon]
MTNATFSVYLDTGGSDGSPGTSTDIDALGPPTLKFKNADNPTIDTNDKLSIPAAGTIYSYWKSIYLKCDANADAHTINNIKIYSDGSNGLGTGVDIMAGLQFPTHNSGATTGYEIANNANELVAEHGGVTSSASIFGYTSAAGLAVSISESGSVINAANETTNYVILQMNVASTASPGATATETLTFSYDEA